MRCPFTTYVVPRREEYFGSFVLVSWFLRVGRSNNNLRMSQSELGCSRECRRLRALT